MTSGPVRHLLHVFPTFAIGGAQVRTVTLINHFGDRCRHTILALDGRFEAAVRIDGAVTVTLAAPPPRLYARAPVRLLTMAWLLRQIRPDVLLTYNWGAIEWAAVNALGPRLRHVHAEDGFGVEESVQRKTRRSWFRRLALVGTDAIVVPSETLAEIARREWGVPAQLLHRIDNGVDLERFMPRVLETPVRATDVGITIGTVAPLRPEKNLSRLIRVFSALRLKPSPRLVVAGDGAERPRLETLAHRLGVSDRVLFTGHVAEPEFMLSRFDVFAISSDTEQQPVTVIEAMAAGKPIVGVDVGDIRTMVAPENRNFIVPPGDEAALIRAMERLATDSSTRALVGAANRRLAVDRFGVHRMYTSYSPIYTGA
ncbi:MAG: glycosyltransferase family 4 protein [Rhodospirillaceae bacterium]